MLDGITKMKLKVPGNDESNSLMAGYYILSQPKIPVEVWLLKQ